MTSTRRRVAALAGVVLVLIVFGVGWLLVGGEGDREDGGPVRVAEGNGLSTSAPVGKQFMFGVPVVYNQGDTPAELEAARFVEATPGMKVVKTYVAGPKRGAEYTASARSWPQRSVTDLSSLNGYELAPERQKAGQRGAELVFVLQVEKPGRYVTRGAELDYKVDGKSYRRAIPSSLAVCGADQPNEQLVKLKCKFPPRAEGEL